MQKLEFTPEELDVLRDLLQHYLNDIDVEVFRTDTHDFKAMLKHRRETIEHNLSKVSTAPVGA